MTSLLPVSYQPETEGEPSSQYNLEERCDDGSAQVVSPNHVNTITSSQNGVDQPTKEGPTNDMDHSHQPSSSATMNVSSLHLDPLPLRSSDDPLPTSHSPLSSPPADFTPDPKTLKLAPLPPFTSDGVHQLPTKGNNSKMKDAHMSPSYGSKADRGSHTPESAGSTQTTSTRAAAMTAADGASEGEKEGVAVGSDQEVFNDEFGIQETSVFAVNSNPSKESDTTNEHSRIDNKSNTVLPASVIKTASPSKLISSFKSAFSPVARHNTQNSGHPSSKQTTVSSKAAVASSAAAEQSASTSQSQTLSSLQSSLSSKSTMDTVTLREFTEAFMQGDTTNWFQRMKLFDHIEAVQDKVMAWMEIVDSQLDGKCVCL